MPPHLNLLDRAVCEFDALLRAVCPPKVRVTANASPAEHVLDATLTDKEREHTIGLMRVNHAGEVCAQALYRAQAITATSPQVQAQMATSAEEEIDHLAWCEERLAQLGGGPSRLNLVWYLGSFTLGMFAGLISDKISLGFVAETEYQVAEHLQSHLSLLPESDHKSHAIISQMHDDELKHAKLAEHAGGQTLPLFIKEWMGLTAKLLTRGSYYL